MTDEDKGGYREPWNCHDDEEMQGALPAVGYWIIAAGSIVVALIIGGAMWFGSR